MYVKKIFVFVANLSLKIIMNTWLRDIKMVKLLYNALRTPDGTVLNSRSRHDYNTYEDTNGKTYMIDGGLDYVRCSAHGDEEHLCVWSDDSHDVIREHVEWGTYGKDGDQALKYVKIKDMTTDHLEACVRTQKASIMFDVFVTELDYRAS